MPHSPARQALLKQKANEYIASMEASDRDINYNRLETDRLLMLEAINDWTGRTLAEGADIKVTYGGDDPCCATEDELNELVRRLHNVPVVLYPVSGFSLSDKDELRFSFQASSFRMVPYASGSRADGIAIAEAKHIRDVEAAMQLWVFCATEDCMAYLDLQMDIHGLFLEEEERAATRRIITSFLQDQFSIGQIWNAIWRSVKDAAALSTRKYYNYAKAAQTIPKKIDKVLINAAGDPTFAAYERIAATPLGAVLTLFLHRFGVNDSTAGSQVRAKLTVDASQSTPEEVEEEEIDVGRGLIQGTMFFHRQFTELDRLVLSCFKGLEIELQEPEWDENHEIGRLCYSLADIYAFDGHAFANKLFDLLHIVMPSNEDIARHAAAASEYKERTHEWVDVTGWSWALSEAMVNGGVASKNAAHISSVIRYPAAPDEVVQMIRYIPAFAGLCAIRVNQAYVNADYIEKSDSLCVGDFNFSIPEGHLEPVGCDQDIVLSVATQNLEHLSNLIANSIWRSISCWNDNQRRLLLSHIAQKLLEQAEPMEGNGGST
ncbi:hypothetical protein JD974_01800 [Chromobacterium haemolyticum]|uniref:Uncharacterized protein n=1 Tax=Chromobacterium haemolyticum TaxID=394935 RepID=A0ABS3GGQ3_9NEIS|nr:hypothetical protein [Chromobacterium haemolyticum]MBK0413129.1 hypothetical protein [Chromobacterium haemolyticum]MBO0414231.1 hypothetical protein [Chromobacterium haemolyticum]MBO0497491.1 hypothetical protein [Chromobacterium haemolyticum]